MTAVVDFFQPTAVSSADFQIPEDSAAIIAVPDLKDAYYVQPASGKRGVVVIRADLQSAASTGGPVIPTWTSAERVISVYGLEDLVQRATDIMREIFGDEGSITADIFDSPDSVAPTLTLTLRVPRPLRSHRKTYLDRYAKEIEVPDNAPVPALLWTYYDAVQS